MDRLDLQHHAFRLTLDGQLYRAPIPKDVHRVLDLGCGTGIWAIEFSDEFPSAQVLGTDLSPIQPEQVPPNCEFLIDDCTKDWIFHNQFDYIHTRAMVAAIKDWSRLFEQAYANLKPGGYMECQELVFPLKCMDPGVTAENSPLMRWSDLFFEATHKIGLDAAGPRHLAPRFRDAGFVDINVKTYKWPLGKWAKGAKFKLLGRFVYEDLWDALPSLSLGLFTRTLQWTREEVEVFLAECRQESKRKDRHYYGEAYVPLASKQVMTMLISVASSGMHKSPRMPASPTLDRTTYKTKSCLSLTRKTRYNKRSKQCLRHTMQPPTFPRPHNSVIFYTVLEGFVAVLLSSHIPSRQAGGLQRYEIFKGFRIQITIQYNHLTPSLILKN